MTPRELSERLVAYTETICHDLLPGGRRLGAEYCAGSVRGEEGKSLKVRLTGPKTGLWADFATGDKGDLITLYQLAKGVTLKEAIEWAKSYLGVTDDTRQFAAPPKPRGVKPTQTVGVSDPVAKWFLERGIEAATLKAYGLVARGTVAEFPFLKDGLTYMVKYRDTAKPKGYTQQPGGVPVLFGWPAVPADAREIVITEGECDAMAYFEQGIPALSIPLGAGVGGKMDWIANEFDALERFDTIYLSLDMDDEGRACVDEYVRRLGCHRTRVVDLPLKDANECLLDGFALKDFMDNARYLDPKELRSATSFADEVWDEFYPKATAAQGIAMPWSKTTNHFRLRPGEVTAWLGINGHGKTKLLGHVSVYGMAQSTRWLIASMEMRPAVTLKTLYQQASGIETPSDTFFESIKQFMDSRCWIINITGTAKGNRLLELCRYAWKRYGIHHVVIDSLSKCGIAEDDYNGQKDFIDQLGDLARETAMHVHVVMHSRKRENEDHAPNKMDAKGSGALTDMVDNVVTVWRNKPKEEKISNLKFRSETIEQSLLDKPDCVVHVQKQRHFDWEGKFFLYFDQRTHQYLDQRMAKPFDYVSEQP